MIPFARVPTDLWLSPTIRKSDRDYALLCAFYHSHPAQGIEGFSRCSDHYVTDYLSLTKAKVTKLRRQMMKDNLIVYDEDTEEMYLLGFLLAHPLKGETNAVSLKKNVDRLRSTAIRDAVIKDAGEGNLTALLEKHAENQASKAHKKHLQNSTGSTAHIRPDQQDWPQAGSALSRMYTK